MCYCFFHCILFLFLPSEQVDFEEQNEYTINISVSDSGNPPRSYSGEFIIEVLDVNEAPSPPTCNNTEIAENSPIGTVIGYLQSRDPDANQTLTFHIIQRTRLIGLKNNALIVNGNLDYEQTSIYDFLAYVVDDGTPNMRGVSQISIQIIDVNEAPTAVELNPRIIPEYIAAKGTYQIGTKIGEFKVEDPDPEDTHKIEMINQGLLHPDLKNLTCFSINDNNELLVNNPNCFDYEKQRVIGLVVKVTDSEGLELVARTELYLSDQNDPPQRIAFIGATNITDDVPQGSYVGRLMAVDDVDMYITWIYTYKLLKESDYFIIERK